ncbi:MAG: sulfatase [Puniceicoccaceae bacterium]
MKIGYLLIALVFTHAAAALAAVQERPNIIFILTDDQRHDAMGVAGNSIIQTPNLDQLAGDGWRFENAFVTTPICAASRASILTGLYERTHKFTFGTPPLSKEHVDQSYPKLLKEAGYQTGFIGKFGMKCEDELDKQLFDFDRRPGEQFWAITYYRLNSDHTGHKHLTTELGNLSVDFIEQRDPEKPFCLSISFHAPHAEDVSPEQFIYPVETRSLYKDIEIPEPLMSGDDDFESQPIWVREGLNRVRWYWRFDTAEKYQRMVKGYYRMISAVDAQIGRIRDTLKAQGIEKNTLIIFMSDNGYFLGERQLAGKWLMYENSLRVPMIVFDPRAKKKGTVSEMALNIDIAPTILDYAGIEIPESMQGRPLQPLLGSGNTNWRTDFLCEHLMETSKIPKSEGIRTERFKYFRYIDHPEHEELYDLTKDPMERTNLANRQAMQEILQGFRTQLEQH